MKWLDCFSPAARLTLRLSASSFDTGASSKARNSFRSGEKSCNVIAFTRHIARHSRSPKSGRRGTPNQSLNRTR